jgi:capsular polysaccharide export protein
MIAVFSRGILPIPNLNELLGSPVAFRPALPAGLSAVAGWGHKATARSARDFATRHALPFWALEDGFLRSVGLAGDDPPLSIVVDDIGIYYNAAVPSRLETMIAAPHDSSQGARARSLIAQWRAARVSKYNHLREYAGPLQEHFVLVIDQTHGDASIEYGLAGPQSFQRMLDAALAENPDCKVLLKIHPDVFAGKKRGYFDAAKVARDPRVSVLAEDVHPVALIEHARAVYTVTSQIGFEGLLWGKPVRTFGMPFYAGWGLTRDELPAPGRRRPVALEDLVHAALVDYPRYIDPEMGTRCEPERLLEWMGLQRRMRGRFPSTVYATGFSIFKRPVVKRFFDGSDVRFVRRPEQVPDGGLLAVWGRKDVSGGSGRIKTIHLEDGFLRSVGLGADLVRPLSWVMDEVGIYYDATRPSRLEHLLQTADFDATLLARAAGLREAIRRHGLTKYNVGAGQWRRPEARDDAATRVILVPGQVETDASIAYGAPEIKHNIELLRAVRAASPGAYVVYKPHPDVVAGLRKRGAGEEAVALSCDEMVVECTMGELLDAVDEVHTITSLAGFEALLRGKTVVCYGHPFYAGWGLTRDIYPMPRRSRRLEVNQLVAGALILYPAYVSRVTGRFTTAERALEELIQWREHPPTPAVWRKWLHWILTIRKY